MRTCKRLKTKKEIYYHSNNVTHGGIILNCSERGMYIETIITFPFCLVHEILIPYKHEIIKVGIKVLRLEKNDLLYNGMGVKIIRSNNNYSEFLSWLYDSQFFNSKLHNRQTRINNGLNYI